MSGVLYIVADVVIWRCPVKGTLAFVWVLGLSALVSGALMVTAAYGLKKVR